MDIIYKIKFNSCGRERKRLGFMVEAMLGIMGSQSLLHLGALSVRLSTDTLSSLSGVPGNSCDNTNVVFIISPYDYPQKSM